MMRGLAPHSRPRPGQFVLLAPSAACVPASFPSVRVNPVEHERILAGLQRLRGRVYLQDGAIDPSQLSPDGRHVLDVDYASWHLVSLHADDCVTGCARYRPHAGDVRPEDLGVWTAALARQDVWQHTLRQAIEGEIALARQRNLAYVEVGGWAIAEHRRFTPEAVEIALSAYALARRLGGCVGITTATSRNQSSRILRKIGGQPLEVAAATIPSYYDPQYRCEMELLRFDSGMLNPKYEAKIDSLASRLSDLTVVCATDGAPIDHIDPATTKGSTWRRRESRTAAHAPRVRRPRIGTMRSTPGLAS